MPYLIIAVLVVAALAWAGQNRQAVGGARVLRALLAGLAAVGAVAVGLRGLWLPGLVLIALSGWLAGEGWRLRHSPPANPLQDMSPSDARATLGVNPGASREEIDAAYRRLMLRAHPDHGGTSGLAARLNAARELLLKQL